MIFSALLGGAIVPALVAGSLALTGGFLPGFIGTFFRRLSLPLGFLTGFYLINSLPSWPPEGSTGSLFYIASLAFFWPFVEAQGGRYSRSLRWLYFAGIVFLLLKPFFQHHFDRSDAAIHLFALMLLGQFFWYLFNRSDRFSESSSLCLVAVIVGTGLSLLCLLSGSALVSQLAGVYCAVHGALFVLTLFKSRFYVSLDHQSFSITMLFSFAVLARYFLDVPYVDLGLVLLPLLLLSLMPMIPFQPKRKTAKLILVASISLLPIIYVLYPKWSELGMG